MKGYPRLLMALILCISIVRSTSAHDRLNIKKRIEFYVSINGNDVAEGSIKKPFQTIYKAVNVVRELRASGNITPVVIYLREGRHQLDKTLILGLNLGIATKRKKRGLKEMGVGKSLPAGLTFSAYKKEKPILSAGIPVLNWKLAGAEISDLPSISKGKVWVADIPKGMERFYTLYDSKGRLNRARNSGFAPTKTADKKTIYFPSGTLKNWSNMEDIEIQVRPSRAWAINMIPLESVNVETGIATTSVSATYEIGQLQKWVHNPTGSTIWVENILEALDEPGEWVVNTKTGKIYLWPANPAANGTPEEILAPSTSELIRVEGVVDYDGAVDKAVHGITFSGLTFTHGDRRAWKTDVDRLGWGMQHDWDLFDRPTAMLRFRAAEGCEVINCNFVNSGGTGVRMDLHAQYNRIKDCEFAHLGEAGIILAGYGPGTKDVNHHNDISNNHIHHFSEITWHSPGIWAWQSGSNHIFNNYIHHSGYAGIFITNRVEPDRNIDGEGGRTVRQNEIPEEVKNSVKETYENWKVREKYNHSRHNLLEYNEITHAVQKLSDGNAIYVSGAGTGNIVRYNYIHDNLEHSFPAAIRCDDDQHETLIYGNILYNNYGFSAGIASKGINDIINNFIVSPVIAPNRGYISFEWVRVTNSKIYNNILVSNPEGGKAYGEHAIPTRTQDGNPLITETDMDNNLYYNVADSNWMQEHFVKMRTLGKEKESLFADPMFIDPENENFGFKKGSPAFKLGIEELDVSKMGLISK